MFSKQCHYKIIGSAMGCINSGYAVEPNYLNNGTAEDRARMDAKRLEAYGAARRVFAEGYDAEKIYRYRHDAETKAKELEDITGYKWALMKCYAGDDENHPDDDEEFIEPNDDDSEEWF